MSDELNNSEEDLIDIISYFKTFWIKKKLIVNSVISSFLVGCVVALIIPASYSSQTTFVPQVSEDQVSPATKGLGSLAASLAGIKINQSEVTSDSYLSPLLYTKITDSEEFSLELLDRELINSKTQKFTIREYLLSTKSKFNFNIIGFIKKYTINLFLKNEPNGYDSDFFKNYNFIDKADYSLIYQLRSKFKIELNEKEGYIKVVANDKDPFISTQLVEKITKSLQTKIIEIRTTKIKERLKFSKEQYELKQKEFDSLQVALAEFKDSNKSISTARFMSELQKLESEYQLQENILTSLASEFNNNKIKLNKNTPIFSVIDEVSVPNEKASPNRGLIVIIFGFVGFLLSVTYILSKEYLINIIQQIKN